MTRTKREYNIYPIFIFLLSLMSSSSSHFQFDFCSRCVIGIASSSHSNSIFVCDILGIASSSHFRIRFLQQV